MKLGNLPCIVNPTLYVFQKQNLTQLLPEVLIDGYSNIRRDRNRHGGGVACYVSNLIYYNERTDFSNDFENIFIDILLPKTTPILFGVVYRPPSTLNFDKQSC